MSTITPEQEEAIRKFVMSHELPRGLGSEERACSIAAINLALSGKLTDTIPACMSPVIGRWIICVQDAMPDEMRNSDEWKRLLPLAAGTGRDKEEARHAIILDWMWTIVLPTLQPIAEKRGFGKKWETMLAEKTSDSARLAQKAADAANAAADAAAYAAADAAADAYVAAYAADVAAYAAYAADADARKKAWAMFAPAALLAKLVQA